MIGGNHEKNIDRHRHQRKGSQEDRAGIVRPAPGTYKEFVKLASIKGVEGAPKANDMIRHLVAAQEATARTARKLFPLVDAANDQPTAMC